MDQADLFDAGVKARDDGIAAVTTSNLTWMDRAIEMVRDISQFIGTGEDLRHLLLHKGLSVPSHPNAWGALIRQCRNENLIHTTGRWRRPRDKASHARPILEYRKP